MQCKDILLCFFVLAMSSTLLAQTDFEWIGTGKVKARITPTGIHRNAQGGFFLESNIPGQPAKNILSHLGPWVGGLDPGENIKVAIEGSNLLASDWKSGFRDIPNSGNLWTVTAEQMLAHRNDFLDNGIIDNPIPEIFAWPAFGNPFSESYNGFSVDSIHFPLLAPFMDYDWDCIYNPAKGDAPLEWFGSEIVLPIKTLIFSPFFDNMDNNTAHKATDLDLYMLVCTLDCNENDLTQNTIFFEYGGFFNKGYDRIDSLHMGVFADFDIGNIFDDYIGSIETGSNGDIFYAYNSDTLVDMFMGANPPIAAIMPLSMPYGEFEPISLTSFMPLFYSSLVPSGALTPTYSHEYFNFLTGTWLDGTPITSGGIGYNPGSSTPLRKVFPDNPSDEHGWSELSENNPNTDRKFIASFGSLKIKPYGYSSRPFVFALTVSDKVGLTAQLEQLVERRALLGDLFDWCIDCPLETFCAIPTSVLEVAYRPQTFPNPTQKFVTLKTPGIDIYKIFISNALGQKVSIDPPQFSQENEVRISLENLPAGVYFIQWSSKNGQRGCEKVVKN